MDTHIAEVLLQGELFAVAVAAQALDPRACREDSHLRGIGLGDWCQKVEQETVSLFFLPIEDLFKIVVDRTLCQEGERSIHDGTLQEEHALDVAVFNDRDLGGRGVFLGEPASLQPLFCVLERGVVGGRGDTRGAETYTDTGPVHHLEHLGQPLVGLPGQPAAAVVFLTQAELDDRRTAIAHLVVDSRRTDIVELKPPIRSVPFPRYHEEGDSLDARWRPLDLCQEEVDDVVDAVMIGSRDEDLLSLELVVPIVRGFGRAADIGKRAARLGFGEGHGPLPLSRHHLGEIFFLHLFGSEGFD